MATSRVASSLVAASLRLVAAASVAGASLLPLFSPRGGVPTAAAVSGCPALSGFEIVSIAIRYWKNGCCSTAGDGGRSCAISVSGTGD